MRLILLVQAAFLLDKKRAINYNNIKVSIR
jgi:hypothetical protein